MPKKLDIREELKTLESADEDQLKSITTRVSVRCLRQLYRGCLRADTDVSGLVRQILEEQAPSYAKGSQSEDSLSETARKCLPEAVRVVQSAYRKGDSPIDAIMLATIPDNRGRKTLDYDGPLAPLVKAAVAAVPIQEILDSRLRQGVESQRKLRQESNVDRQWRRELEKASAHVREHALKLGQLELEYHARKKLAFLAQEEGERDGPVLWIFDSWTMDQLQREKTDHEAVRSLQLLIQPGYLTPYTEDHPQPHTYVWDG